MNSQIVSLIQALKSPTTFYLITSFIPISIFFNSGFTSVSVVWFFVFCLYNADLPLKKSGSFALLVLLIAFYALNLPWMIFSSDPSLTYNLTLRKIHLFLIPAGFICVGRRVSKRGLHFFLSLFIGCCLLYTVIFLGAVFIHIVEGTFVDDPGMDFSPDGLVFLADLPPTYLSLFCIFAFLCTIESPFLNSKLKQFLGCYLAAFVILISPVIGVIILAITFLCWLPHGAYRKKPLFVLGGTIFLGVIFFFFVHFQQYNDLESRQRSLPKNGAIVKTIPERRAIWSYAWDTLERMSLVGYGTGLGQKALEKTFQKEGFLWGIRESLNPHSQYFSTLLDLGLPGFAMLSIILIYPFILAIRAKSTLVVCFIVMISLFFCFESVLIRQKGIVFFAFFYTVLTSSLENRTEKRANIF